MQRNELDKVPVTNPKVIEICDFSDKEFKIAIFKKLNELQENTEKEFRSLSENLMKRLK